MADISILKVNDINYNIKDKVGRDTATQAKTIANEAKTTADSAIDMVTETDNKITNAKIEGVYTTETETLEYKLKLGGN